MYVSYWFSLVSLCCRPVLVVLVLLVLWWLQWHPLLTMLKERIEEFTGYTFNSLLCNLYRNEKDSVDWHSDDEPSLGKNPVIASLSFGATRTFEMRKKPSPVSVHSTWGESRGC